MEIPTIIDDQGNPTGANSFMTKIIVAYTSYQSKQTELSSEYEALMEVIKENIEMVTDVVSANEVATTIANMQHIFDSKLRAGMLLNDKCKSLGLKFNKLSKKYESAA